MDLGRFRTEISGAGDWLVVASIFGFLTRLEKPSIHLRSTFDQDKDVKVDVFIDRIGINPPYRAPAPMPAAPTLSVLLARGEACWPRWASSPSSTSSFQALPALRRGDRGEASEVSLLGKVRWI